LSWRCPFRAFRSEKDRSNTTENEEQRRSFAYGNTRIENLCITREMVDREAEALDKAVADSSPRSEWQSRGNE